MAMARFLRARRRQAEQVNIDEIGKANGIEAKKERNEYVTMMAQSKQKRNADERWLR